MSNQAFLDLTTRLSVLLSQSKPPFCILHPNNPDCGCFTWMATESVEDHGDAWEPETKDE